ncbi:MAG TPA: ABC transporter substrate-binding protein [Actinophytocola sp.]|jgi:oligopeptide transport system substrate-binding protein|uniref:ABC transporter substrate-binding protein n=1 Tax=Actinophytocola sp. TaxID=1872138 RepID=UPI002F93A3AD
MRGRRFVFGLIAVSQVALVGADVAGPGTAAFTSLSIDEPLVDGHSGGTFRLVSPEPISIDPSNTANGYEMQVTSYLFTGLVTVAPNGAVSRGVATDWTKDAGCVRWTFHLARGTRFHNGEEVTSRSFKRGWKRAASGRVAWLLKGIDTVDATDPYTLRVALVPGDCEFLQRMIHPVFSPVPSNAGPAGNDNYNDRPIGNGPFRMGGPWRHNSHIRLVRYDGYRLGRKASLAAVDIATSINPAADSYRAFRSGKADWAQLPKPGLPSPRPGDVLVPTTVATVSYLLPAVTTKPLDSAPARKAISLAIDRAAIARETFAYQPTPATSLVPPPVRRSSASALCGACRFDPAEARRLAKIAGLTRGTVVHFRYADRARHEKWTSAIKRQLESTLGITVNYYNLPFAALLENEVAPGVSGITLSGWGMDYPSPGDALATLLSTREIGTLDPAEPATGGNAGRYSNPRVDRLLDQARLTANKQAREIVYERAERIAIGADLAVIPLFYHRDYRLAAGDRFVNLRTDWSGNADLAAISLR